MNPGANRFGGPVSALHRLASVYSAERLLDPVKYGSMTRGSLFASDRFPAWFQHGMRGLIDAVCMRALRERRSSPARRPLPRIP